ncbi:MAG TPA: YciI family protein [Vicinamibacterales bacterium]|nr:YciI family protein [Vicinamibacterales bacterium]
MKFLMMIKHAESPAGLEHPEGLHAAMGKLVEEGFKSGILKDTAGLKRTADGYWIRSKGGKLTRTDGPFAESKEVVGGYAIVETATREEADKVAEQFMELHRIHVPDFECECEVRPLEES